ncbi:exosortase N [Flavobacterium resistens]|uniref:Exosortase N n=1 Tax=Flavobacterium resistens TaxID=443612 RepID=A0A521CYM5_9FLAO|nr:exosortase N [Flavobacterium resistens]MRX67131.1 exosortase N [Flavobacterium resistens]SMO64534.1 exosortase N [Flavobacterium resistens]
MNLLLEYKKTVLLIFGCLLLLNYSIISAGLNNNLFGILASIGLFFIGSRKTTFNISYPLFAMIFILEFISFRLHTKSLHLLALALFVCLLYYSFTQKFSFIALICILLFSSVFSTFFDYMTTEIKQILCYHVYIVLKNFIVIDKIEGVNFYINNAKITVDTACMGLSMFKTGLLSGAFILTLEEKKQSKYFNILQIFLFCVVVIILNIISNYFRIITLILFQCTQENVLHHTIGILCFVFYQIVPMLFLIHFFKPKTEEIQTEKQQHKFVIIIVATSILFATSFEIKKIQPNNLLENLSSEYSIQNGTWVNNEVFKISTPSKLIYIKTPAHNPLVCWTGNGYKIIEKKETARGNQKIWQVKMEKNNIQYNSYWWYECDSKKYTSLPEVLLIKLFTNKSVRLINETTKIQQ